MSSLKDALRHREPRDITCKVSFYSNKTVTFIWELVQQNGDVITLPGYIRDIYHNETRYISMLNYTLSSHDAQSILRCVVLVDDDTLGRCESKDEERILSYGKCND